MDRQSSVEIVQSVKQNVEQLEVPELKEVIEETVNVIIKPKSVETLIQECKNGNFIILDLSFRLLDKLPPELKELTSVIILNLSGNFLQEVTEKDLPPNIKILNLSRNNFQEFPIGSISNKVNELNLDDNMIKQLIPAATIYLIKLSAAKNKISKLSTFPPYLEEVNLIDNEIQEVPMFPNSLRKVKLSLNIISVFPFSIMNEGLEYIDLSINFIENFPKFPDSVEHIFISENKLHVIDQHLPSSLLSLVAFKCKIKKITVPLPASMERLDLCDNHLDKIPSLPMMIEYVDMSNNTIDDIEDDEIPTTVTYLDVSDNRISDIPEGLKTRLDFEFDYSNNLVDFNYDSDDWDEHRYINPNQNHFKSLGEPNYNYNNSTNYQNYRNWNNFNNTNNTNNTTITKIDFSSKNIQKNNPNYVSIRNTKTINV